MHSDYLVVSAAYTHLVDVYKQFDSQDSDTGAIIKEWQFDRTVPCYAKGIISNSATGRGGDRQQINSRYENVQIIEIRSSEKLTIREKITNVRTEHGEVIWTELDFPTETPTVFEVIGSTPMTDPFGDVLAYNSTMKRSENQQIGQ
jgi:hypothetical protein